MPIFEYRCKQCDSIFEALVFSKSEEIHCPSCEGKDIEKMLSTFGVANGNSNPCAGGACGLPEPMPQCGQGACPSCMN